MALNPTTVPGAALTPRERELLDLLVDNYPNLSIVEAARQMGISTPTARQYISQAKVKMQALTTFHLLDMHQEERTA